MAELEGKSVESGENALAEAAGRVLENLAELEPELVSAGIFDRDGRILAFDSASAEWPGEAAELLEALAAGSGEPEAGSGDNVFTSAHIAGADGEVFAVRESGLSLVAVTGRFVLASLTSYDMRMALRDAVRTRSAPGAEKEGDGDA